MTRKKMILLTLGVVAAAGGVVSVVGSRSGVAQASYGALSTSTSSGPVAAQDATLQALRRENPKLDLDAARVVIEDSQGTVWLTKATDGDVCLIEKTNGGLVTSRFACKHPSDIEREGLVGGVPGRFYGVVPDGVTSVAAEVDGDHVTVPVRKNAFVVPSDATALGIGNANEVALPRPVPHR